MPGLPERRGAAEGVTRHVRSPALYRVLRAFCLGAFRFLAQEVEQGAEIPFAFEEHGSRGRPALYEYRPLVGSYVDARGPKLAKREDAAIALDELRREPAAAIFARAHAGARPSEDEALFRSVLLPLLVATADACGGFDWDDGAFDRAYAPRRPASSRRTGPRRRGCSRRTSAARSTDSACSSSTARSNAARTSPRMRRASSPTP